MRVRLGIIAAVLVWLGWVGGLAPVIQAGQPEPGGSTPELIEAARARGDIDQETAYLYLAYALGDYEKLPPEYRSQVPWDGTLPLLDLQQAARTMSAGPARQEIVVILSGLCDPYSSPLTILNSAHFHIEYSSILGGLNINTYANSLDATWNQEVTSFGWAAPPVLSSNPPPGNLYHVRIENLGASLYGYVTNSGAHAGFVGNNPNTAWNDVDAYATCMVLNRDYSPFPGSAQQALDATTAHEFNHSIQFGYGALLGSNVPDDSFVEGGATWMEDEVFDAANDNYNYLWPTFSMCMGQYTASPYPYWITFRGLTERYGAGSAGGGEQVMQDFWQLTSQSSSSNMLTALNSGLANKGTTLADAYHAYAVAVKFNKTCGGGYVYPYCFEEAAGYVATRGPTTVHGSIAAIGGSYTGSLADNYALNWISLPTGSAPYNVTLQNTSGGGQLRGSVVCDTGSVLNINALRSAVGPGGSTSLFNINPSGCSSVVAVLTNQSQTAANPASCTARSFQFRTQSGGPSSGNIVVNELDTGDADAVELYNPDGQAVVMTGWNFRTYSGSGSLEVNYTFPSFTLQPGAYVVLHKGSGSNTPSDLYLNSGITWVPDGSGAAALIGGSGNGVDFVRFGGSSVAPPAGTNWTGANPAGPPAGQTLGRGSTSMDTDNGSDWCAQTATPGTGNVGCGSGGTIIFLPVVFKNAAG